MVVSVGQSSDRPVAALHEDDIARGVFPRFRDVVAAQPQAVAVSDDTAELTYADLAAQSARILAVLRRTVGAHNATSVTKCVVPSGNPTHVVGKNSGTGRKTIEAPSQTAIAPPNIQTAREPIALLFGHTTAAIAALMAVLASGHPVLVLDQRCPGPRLKTLVEQAGARIILCDEPNEPLGRELCTTVVVPLREELAASVDILWDAMPDPKSVAALAFTSGTTGVPKPVANDHHLLIRDAWNSSIATGCYGANDIIAHTLPIAFHAGLTTTVHGLLVGACLRLFDVRERGIEALPEFIAENRCSIMISSPGILRAFAACEPEPEKLASLTSLTIAGETAYGRDVQAIRTRLPKDCVIRNRYGSSETGLIAEYVITRQMHELPDQLPIGRGVGWTILDAVDGQGKSVPIGETGIITVRAPAVALGYWRMPEATQKAFHTNTDGTRTYRSSDLGRRLPDGCIEIVGRADHSVKIRGYLVDPGEVDAALFTLPDVREAVVVGVRDPHAARNRLIAYVVPARAHLREVDILQALRGKLPSHMIPEVVVFLNALPRNERGKIDRPALPEPTSSGPAGGVNYSTEWEEIVAYHWADILEVDKVGISDDFFALGGDSLAAEALMSRMVNDHGINPDVARTATLAEHRVLRDFARALQRNEGKPRASLVTLRATGSKLPIFCIAGGGGMGITFQPLAQRLDPQRPVYALQSPVIESPGLPELSVVSMARRRIKDMRAVHPHGPYTIIGHSFGGLIAIEVAHQLRVLGQDVEHLVVLDSFPPDPRRHPPYDRTLRQRLRMMAAVLWTSLRNTSGGVGAYRLWEQSRWLGHHYHGAPWSGKTLVLLADSPQRELRAAWDGSLTGQWQLRDVGGDHFTMLRSPWVNQVAQYINTFLEHGMTADTVTKAPAVGHTIDVRTSGESLVHLPRQDTQPLALEVPTGHSVTSKIADH